jgi:hypothetical protein
LNVNRLLSDGAYDEAIKLLSLSSIELTIIKEITGHTEIVLKLIPLSNERFASSSYKTVRV